jgi:hypothetical protein
VVDSALAAGFAYPFGCEPEAHLRAGASRIIRVYDPADALRGTAHGRQRAANQITRGPTHVLGLDWPWWLCWLGFCRFAGPSWLRTFRFRRTLFSIWILRVALLLGNGLRWTRCRLRTFMGLASVGVLLSSQLFVQKSLALLEVVLQCSEIGRAFGRAFVTGSTAISARADDHEDDPTRRRAAQPR